MSLNQFSFSSNILFSSIFNSTFLSLAQLSPSLSFFSSGFLLLGLVNTFNCLLYCKLYSISTPAWKTKRERRKYVCTWLIPVTFLFLSTSSEDMHPVDLAPRVLTYACLVGQFGIFSTLVSSWELDWLLHSAPPPLRFLWLQQGEGSCLFPPC